MVSHSLWPAQEAVLGAARPCLSAQLPCRRYKINRSALRKQLQFTPCASPGIRTCQETAPLHEISSPVTETVPMRQSPTQEGLVGLQPYRAASMATLVAAVALLASCIAAGPAAAGAEAMVRAVTGPIVPGLLGDSPLREGLVSGFLLIFFSELGDKTFFIAVLLALKYPLRRKLVFAGSFGALAVMTVISVGLGLALHEADQLIDTHGVPLDDLIAVALLLFFGIRTLQEAAGADEKAKEEEEDALEATATIGIGAGLLYFQIFALVFAAEWGDKSFLATIALAASSSPLGVVGGAISGHAAATVLAITGGSVLSKYVSERTVQYVGGSLFLVFAASTIVDIVRGV